MEYTKEKLKIILEDHKLWIESGGTQGNRANLTGADLTDSYLQWAMLAGANLTKATLDGAKLTRSILTGSIRD